MLERSRTMSDATRSLLLRIALVATGLTFIFGIYPLGIVWPSGWTWGHGHSHYLKPIIWFTVWSSVVHGAIMAVQAWYDKAESGHLIGDVPALLLVAIILAVLMPRTKRA